MRSRSIDMRLSPRQKVLQTTQNKTWYVILWSAFNRLIYILLNEEILD